MSEKRERELNLETDQISQSTEIVVSGFSIPNISTNLRCVSLIFGLFNCIIIIFYIIGTVVFDIP